MYYDLRQLDVPANVAVYEGGPPDTDVAGVKRIGALNQHTWSEPPCQSDATRSR